MRIIPQCGDGANFVPTFQFGRASGTGLMPHFVPDWRSALQLATGTLPSNLEEGSADPGDVPVKVSSRRHCPPWRRLRLWTLWLRIPPQYAAYERFQVEAHAAAAL